jgi:hypothetical protein
MNIELFVIGVTILVISGVLALRTNASKEFGSRCIVGGLIGTIVAISSCFTPKLLSRSRNHIPIDRDEICKAPPTEDPLSLGMSTKKELKVVSMFRAIDDDGQLLEYVNAKFKGRIVVIILGQPIIRKEESVFVAHYKIPGYPNYDFKLVSKKNNIGETEGLLRIEKLAN